MIIRVSLAKNRLKVTDIATARGSHGQSKTGEISYC